VVTVLVLGASDCVVATVVNATVDGDEPAVAGLFAGTIEINIIHMNSVNSSMN
jgi:hypothetical protein